MADLLKLCEEMRMLKKFDQVIGGPTPLGVTEGEYPI
jgi:hypothetical protein